MKTTSIGDARNRIISIKRNTFSDAREELSKKAKTVDARDKLNLIKNGGITKAGLRSKAQATTEMDMRQKLNKNKATSVQVKKNIQQQIRSGSQNVFKGSRLSQPQNTVQTQPRQVSRTISSAQSQFSRQRVQQQTTRPIQRTVANSEIRSAKPLPLMTIRNAQPQPRRQATTIKRPAQVQTRRVPTASTQQPRTVYRQIPSSRRPVQVSGKSYQQRPAQTVVYRQPVQQTVVYEVPPMEDYAEVDMIDGADPMQEPIYYDDQFEEQPMYDEYEDQMYVTETIQQEAYYGPPAPPQYASAYVPRNQVQQRPLYERPMQPQPFQQRPIQQQRPVQQQRIVQQRPVQQQRIVQQRPVQQRPVQQQRTVQQRPMQQQRTVQQRPMQQQRTVQQSRVTTQQSPRYHQSSNQQQRRTVAVSRQPVQSPKVAGHRVSVSNLHPVATQSDIQELFGNIGPITTAKMVHEGTVIVNFKNLSDARKSVEIYHNRKLDGQPMQVKIL